MKYIPITVPNFSQKGCQTELVIAIDKSGSISKGFSDIIKETIKQIIESVSQKGPFRITLWAFDTSVNYKSIRQIDSRNIDTIDEKLDNVLSFLGGGSSYDESFYMVKALALKPDAVILITDGFMDEPKNETLNIINSFENHVIKLQEENGYNAPIPFKACVHPLVYTD